MYISVWTSANANMYIKMRGFAYVKNTLRFFIYFEGIRDKPLRKIKFKRTVSIIFTVLFVSESHADKIVSL